MPSLFVFRGNDQGMRFELEEPILTLGRDAANSVRLHDTEVSRRHAEMHCHDDKWTLTDLESSNGLFVNGRRVKVHELASGDEIQVGKTQLLFTGGKQSQTDDLAAKIDIIARQPRDDRSRIVHKISQEEGSKILDLDFEQSSSPWLARARSNLQVMYRTALAVSHTLDIDQLLNRIMQLIFEWVEADRGCIMLANSETRILEPKVRRTRAGAKVDERIKISKTILDYVTEHNEGVLTSNAQEDERWNPAASILQMGINEAICVPMRGRYDVVGAIYIDTFTSPQRVVQGAGPKFTQEHLKLMIAIAHQAALAVEDTRHYSALVQAERLAAVGQTIATLSHHIKNILQGIRGGSFLIKEGLTQQNSEMALRGWEFVEKNQDRISNLVMDMLTFSKERQPETAPADMNTVVGDVVELMEARAREMRVSLSFLAGDPMPTLVFDAEGMHRAILNVVSNAIDACEPDERAASVEVRTEFDRAAGRVRIVVSDTGGGISEEEKDKIFSLFVSQKGNRGTGLGLPVSLKIVNEHGGTIDVQSTPGAGSTFTIDIPAVLPEPEKQTITMTSVGADAK